MQTIDQYRAGLYYLRNPYANFDPYEYTLKKEWGNYIIEIRRYMDKNHIHLSDCIEEIKQKKSKFSSKARQMLTIFDTDKLNEILFKR